MGIFSSLPTFDPVVPRAAPLLPLGDHDHSFTISGFNEGGFLAAQMQYSYSFTIKGAGIIHLSDVYEECDHEDYEFFSSCTPKAIPEFNVYEYASDDIQRQSLWL